MKTKFFSKVLQIILFVFTFFGYIWITNALTPTITSTTTWWNWNSASTWAEWRIPTSEDVVQIIWPININNHITIKWLEITENWIFKRPACSFRCSSWYNIIVNGDIKNNWVISWTSKDKQWYFYLHAKKNIINNNIISWVSAVYAYWDIINSETSEFYNNLYLTPWTRKITWNKNFKWTLYLNWDVNLEWDFEYYGRMDMKSKTLKIDWTKNIYIHDIYRWWKIESLNWDGTWEKLKVWRWMNIETNIETLEVIWSAKEIKWKKLVVKWGIQWNLDVEKMTINWLTSLTSTTIVTWDVELTADWQLQRSNCYRRCASYYNLMVYWNLENKWWIWSDGVFRNTRFYVHVYGDMVNSWELRWYYWVKLRWSLENTWSSSSRIYLTWPRIDTYSDYILSLWDEEIKVTWIEYKLHPSYYTQENVYWRVKWVDSVTESLYTTKKCINVDWCVIFNKDNPEPFQYANVEENNSSEDFVLNSASEINMLEKVDINACYKKKDDYISYLNSDEYSKWDPVNLNTWEFTYTNTLMYHNSIWFPFEFKVTYRNQVLYNWPIGYNFDYNYNKYLREDSNWDVYYFDWALWVYKFAKTDTWYSYTWSLKADLSQENWIYKINLDNTKTLAFWDNLRLSSITDNHGNTMLFEYNEKNQLDHITDTLWRQYALWYRENTRLEDIRDFNSNHVKFYYNYEDWIDGSINDLSVIKTLNGTSSKEIVFEYTTWDNHADKHNITKLIDSEKNIYVENTYDENDMVSTQKFGNGTIIYDYTLDADKKITQNRVTDKEWNIVTYTYDSNSNNTKKEIQTTTWTKIYTYKYNEDNKVIEEIHPKWNKYTYAYDTRWNMIEKSHIADWLETLVESYIYDEKFNKLVHKKEVNGMYTNYNLNSKWDVISKLISQVKDIDWYDVIMNEKYSYNDKWELIEKTDANWNKTSFTYLNWNLVTSTKHGISEDIVTSFEYDAFWNVVKTTDGEWNITYMTYDDFNLIKSLKTPEGIVSNYTHNKLNKKTSESIVLKNWSTVDKVYTYDILDNPVKEISDIDSSTQAIKVIEYDNNDNITKTIAPSWLVSIFVYDESGNIIKKTIDGTIVTSYEYDLNNNLVKQINPNGSIVNYEYDLFNRLTKTTNPDGSYTVFVNDSLGNPIQHLVYDTNNNLVKTQDVVYDKLWREIEKTLEGSTVKTRYDSLWNIIEVIDANWNSTTNSFDEFNRLIETTDSLWNKVINTYNKNDKIIEKKIVDTAWKTTSTTYVYDRDNRVLSETDNDWNTTSFSYNNLNQIISKTDANGIITNYTYDYRGKVLSETTDNKTTKYKYDISWNLIELTDTKWNITNYEYDLLNRLVKQTYPDNSFISMTYDVSWNLISKTDANGTVINNTYDDLNRLVSRSITKWTWVEWVSSESYTYDSLGRLVSATDSLNNDISFEYDSLDRLVSETNNAKTVTYDYDNNWNITGLTTPENRSFVYSYDVLNRLTSINHGTWSLVNYSFTWLNLSEKSYSNWTSTTYTYDTLNRLKSIDHSIEWLDDYNYSYDSISNITSNGLKDYNYDSLNQLTKVTDTLSGTILEDYSYDAMWNRDNYDVNVLNQYTSFSGTTFVYDKAGNLTNNGKFSFVYDYKNRLIQATNIETWNTIKYEYDVLWRRVSEEKVDSLKEFIYANNDIVSEYLTSSWATSVTEFVYSNNIDDVLVSFKAEETYFYHKDHIRTVMWVSNNNWVLVDSYEYDSFWNLVDFESTIWNTRLFTWREYDVDTGLYYNRARYYDPVMGRFISRDPIDVGDDVSLYRYVSNNPLSYSDPMGTEAKSMIKKKSKYDRKVWDPRTEERIQTLHPMIRKNARIFINRVHDELWLTLRISTAYRSIEDQDKLYYQSRWWNDWPWRTNAKWWQSYHNYWLAIDITEINYDKYEDAGFWYEYDHKKIGEIGKEEWFEWWWDWSSPYTDRPHFQITFWFKPAELKEMIDENQVDENSFIAFKW